MAQDGLKLLLSVRHRDVDRRRQMLADCMRAEAAAARSIASLEDAMERDRRHQDSFPDHLLFRDIFLAARQHLKSERHRAGAALDAAEARSEAARRQLADARLAAEAVERLIAERALAARAEADRRTQHELDDIARQRRK